MKVEAEALIKELRSAGIRVIQPRPNGNIYVAPKDRLTRDLVEKVRYHKAELLVLLNVEQDRAEALTLLNRLKTFTLPAGRMSAAREIAERCASRLPPPRDGEPDDPASILVVLREIESELIALEGAPDSVLAEAVAIVERPFPGARLIEVTANYVVIEKAEGH